MKKFTSGNPAIYYKIKLLQVLTISKPFKNPKAN